MCGPLLRRFLGRHLMLCLGLGIVLVMSLAALCAPLLAPYDPNALHLDHILEPPSSMFWLGTDRLGRDVFSRLLYGGQISLWVGFVAVGISVSIGTGLGLISGYFGGLVDEGIMRGVDIMLCFPSFFLILSVIAFLEPSLTNIMIVIGLTSVVSAPLLCLVCVVVGAAMLWPGITYYDYLARKSWKIWNRVQGKGKPQLYTFDESTVTEGEGEQKITAPYSEVYAAYESEDHFFLFMSKRDGYIMKKSDFIQGDPAQFAAFLREKTGRDVRKVTLANIR